MRRRHFVAILIVGAAIFLLIFSLPSRRCYNNVDFDDEPRDLESRLERFMKHFEFERSNWAQRARERDALAAQRCGRRGKVSILVMCQHSDAEECMKKHSLAQQSIQCYLLGTPSAWKKYDYRVIDVLGDARVRRNCRHKRPEFRRHCAAAVYASDAAWTLVLEPDMGVVNPDHCLEEYIDDRADLVLYERFANWQIAAGSYLVRNSTRSIEFLKRLADEEFVQAPTVFGADAAAMQAMVLRTAFLDATPEIRTCERIRAMATDYESFMALVVCVKIALGANRVLPAAGIRLLRRAHGWTRDGALTKHKWCERDFMLGGWTAEETSDPKWLSPFTADFNLAECRHSTDSATSYPGWHWRHEMAQHVDEIRATLAYLERSAAFLAENVPPRSRIHSYLWEPDVVECYPFCDNGTWTLLEPTVE